MVDHTRAHLRVLKTEVPGQRWKLSLGTLLLSEGVGHRQRVPLIVHFHGAAWLAESSALRRMRHGAVITVQAGEGSAVYASAFAGPTRFSQLLEEAARAPARQKRSRGMAPGRPQPLEFRPIVLSAFSAGYGAVREILRNRANWDLVDAVLLADGLHTSYIPEGQPGPLETGNLQPFLDFAREAAAGHKQMVITHSEIFPGTFASTTETTDWLIAALQLERKVILKRGPLGMQQLSRVRAGRLEILGFAGNTGPDHIDHFHALEHWLRKIKM